MSVADVIQNLILIDRTSWYEVSHLNFLQKMTVPYLRDNQDDADQENVKRLTPYVASIHNVQRTEYS